MAQDVYTDQIRKDDMVLYRGDWYVVKNIQNYYGRSGLVDEIQLAIRSGRTEWVPVTELRGLEKRPR